jgi:hypothetical protein
MTKIDKIDQETQREQSRADCVAGKNQPLEDALAEGAASGLSDRTIPDIIRVTKARVGDRG